jgi:hypothetical protein
MTKKVVAIIGALDTKGAEYAFLKQQIEGQGVGTLMIDVGIFGEPPFAPDISASEVATAGGADRAALAAANDRGNAVGAMAAGAAIILKRLYDEGRVHGVIAMGGGGGRQAHLLRKAARDGRARSEGDVRRCRKGWRQASDGVQLALLPRRADCKEDGRRRNARPHLRFPRSVAWRTLTSRSGRSSPPSLRLRARWSART